MTKLGQGGRRLWIFAIFIFLLGAEVETAVAAVDEPLGAPTNLSAAAKRGVGIELSWTAPEGAGDGIVGYRVQRREDEAGGEFRAIANTQDAGTAYADGGVRPGATYRYRVRALDGRQVSKASNVVKATALANEPPAFAEGASTMRSVAENAAAGTDIGAPVGAEDPDGHALTYALGGEDGDSFDIDGSSGQLKTRSGIEYDHEAKSAYAVTVTAEDGEGGTASIEVAVSVFDLNEAPAFAEGASTTRSVAENAAADTGLGGPVSAADPDGDALAYALGGKDASAFALGEGGQLRARAPLDYEARAAYAVTVTAEDGRGGTASIEVAVSISDVDEPLGAPTELTAAAKRGVGIELSWTAPEGAGDGIVGYRVQRREDEAGDEFQTVANTQDTGTAYADGDVRAGATYRYRVRALDGRQASKASNVAKATAAGNEPPTFAEGASTMRSVAENAAAGTEVGGPVGAADPEGDTLAYALGGEDGDSFDINESSGQLKTRGGIDYDYEVKNAYSVTVMADDGEGGTASIEVAVSIADVDEPPAFAEGPSTTRSVTENAAAGTEVGAPVGAVDPEGDALAYALDGGDKDSFDIDGASGQLRTRGGIDYDHEVKNAYSVTVMADDGEGGTASIEVAVSISDVDEPPAFAEGPSTTRSVAENAAAGTEVGAPVGAVDPEGDALAYALDGGDKDSFDIDGASGQLRTRGGIDYDHEVKNAYSVTVMADDGEGGTASIEVAVSVADVNEPLGAPTDMAATAKRGVGIELSWMAPEEAGNGIVGYRVQRRRDEGDDKFRTIANTEAAATAYADADVRPGVTYRYRVRALDRRQASKASNAAKATAVGNEPPAFGEGGSTTRSLAENAAAGMDVGAPVSAADPEGDALSYALGGEDGDSFAIDDSSGQLSTRGGIDYDYEVKNAYSVTVTASDEFDASADIDVRIDLSDFKESVANAGWDLTVPAGGTVHLDGSGSTGERAPTWSWSLLSWPGDRAPVLDDASDPTPSFVAPQEGAYLVELAFVSGSETSTDRVGVTAVPPENADALLTADLLVDVDRDGELTRGDERGEDEDAWNGQTGAVFGPNLDDDDDDGKQDAMDDRVNGEADLEDMAPVRVRRIRGLNRKHSAELELSYASSSITPRLFLRHPEGGFEMLIGPDKHSAALPPDRLVAGDLDLHLDSALGRDAGFDGRLSLTLTVRDEAGDAEVSADEVALRGSPILFSHRLQSAEGVFFVNTGSNQALRNALDLRLPESVRKHEIPRRPYGWDRWAQDFMQTGYFQRPTGAGVETVPVHVRLHRPGWELEDFLPNDYLGPDRAYVALGGNFRSSRNYGGNLEVVPPHTHAGRSYPYGRVVIGGWPTPNKGTMVRRQIDFFNAQAVQGPPIQVHSSWLRVGHVDEIVNFVPNLEAGPEDRGWVAMIASSDLAIEVLRAAEDNGYGDVPVLEGRGAETTVSEILADADLLQKNDTAQSRLDSVRETLQAEVGLTDAEFVEVPILFRRQSDGLISYFPSVQNLLAVDGVLIVPDPEGPDVDGVDILQQATRDALKDLGYDIHFVDVYKYHKLSGAIHCGTNVEHRGETKPWWLVEASGEGS